MPEHWDPDVALDWPQRFCGCEVRVLVIRGYLRDVRSGVGMRRLTRCRIDRRCPHASEGFHSMVLGRRARDW